MTTVSDRDPIRELMKAIQLSKQNDPCLIHRKSRWEEIKGARDDPTQSL